jgi:hypothetical protein
MVSETTCINLINLNLLGILFSAYGHYLNFGLYRISFYSVFSLSRFHWICITRKTSKWVWNTLPTFPFEKLWTKIFTSFFRFNDISIPVRQTCVQFSLHFLLNHPDTHKDIVEQLKSRNHDPEETIRMEVVNTVLSVAKKDFSLVTEELLGFIKERTLDKKVSLKLKCCCMQI